MASGSQNMTTYNARIVTGSNSAASPAGALLLSGAGRANDATGDTWIFLDSVGGTSAPWGIKHDQANDKIQIIGAGTNSVWTRMNTGDTYILGKVGIEYDPETSGNTYKLYVNGTSYLNGELSVIGAILEKNGSICIDNTTTDLTASNNGSSSTIYHSIWGRDKANRSWFCVEGYTNANGSVAAFLGVRNYNTSGTAQSWKGITITEAKDNTLTYTVSDPAKFITAIMGDSDSSKFYRGDKTWSNTLTGGLNVSGTSSSSSAVVKITTSNTGHWLRGVSLLNSSLVAGNELMYCVGYADSKYNMGQMYFHFEAAGSTSNRLSLGIHSQDDVLNILADGNIGIGTTNPAYKLDVNGSIHTPTTAAYFGTLGHYSSTAASDVGGLTWQNHDAGPSSTVNANDGPTAAWWYILRNRHTNTSNNYYTDLAIPFNANSIYYKIIRGGSIANDGWIRVLDALNYNDYSPTKTGGGASGTWGISITGNAATATNADKVDNYHASDLWRKDGGTWNGNANIACTPTANGQEYSFDLGNAHTGTYWHVWSGKNSASILQCFNDDRRVVVPVKLETAWLHVVSDSSNNADDALVYIAKKTTNDWALKIQTNANRYGIFVDSLDQDDALRTNGYIRARGVWANQGSNGERQVGADSSTSGNIYLWSNTTNKGLYSGSGHRTGSVILISSTDTRFYGNVTSGSTTYNNGWVELFGGTPYIDFHFKNSTADYTSRIIEEASGQLHISGKLTVGGAVTVSSSIHSTSWIQADGALWTGKSSTYYVALGGQSSYGWIDFRTGNEVMKQNIVGYSDCIVISKLSYHSGSHSSSSRLIKENIALLNDADARKLLQLRPISFKLKEKWAYGDTSRHIGLIAEEVLPILPEVVDVPQNYSETKVLTKECRPMGISYEEIVPYLIKLAQIQQREIDALKLRVAQLSNT